MITGYRACRIYLAVKLHFTNKKYDFFKYGGLARLNKDTYEMRNDKYFFERIIDEYPTDERLIGFFVSNFLENDKFWIGDWKTKDCVSIYNQWLKRTKAIVYNFENDCQKIKDIARNEKIKINQIFKTYDKDYSILELTYDKKINIESYIILDNILKLSNNYSKNILDPYYVSFEHKVKKYSRFLEFDAKKCKTLFIESCVKVN